MRLTRTQQEHLLRLAGIDAPGWPREPTFQSLEKKGLTKRIRGRSWRLTKAGRKIVAEMHAGDQIVSEQPSPDCPCDDGCHHGECVCEVEYVGVFSPRVVPKFDL